MTPTTHESPSKRAGAGVAIMKDKLYVFGGSNVETKFNDLWEFDLKELRWL